MPEETVGTAELAACDCEPCKRKHGQPNAVESRIIHEYSSTPRSGWRPRYAASETPGTVPTFGIELETSAPARPRLTDLPDRPVVEYAAYNATAADDARINAQRAARAAWDVRNAAHRDRQMRRFAATGNITADEAVSMAAPRGLWHAKHDGSVTGPEFASQPGSLAYWRAQRPHLVGMFKALLHGGMRSHDGDTCGFHVNIGIDAFHDATGRIDSGHLARFARLVTMNQRWSVRMAQRTHQSARWAAFDGFPDKAACDAWGSRIATYGYSNREGHSTVLNASHSGRIEFRLPRGTLRVDRFYAKVEWAAAMVEYTRDAACVVQPSAFMRWARDGGEYPALTAMMVERFAARFEGVE